MPFSGEFDDVYATIKTSVEHAFPAKDSRCFRLDETRPAGRITERLLNELQAASLCVADLTGNRPNVMWEVGYAMALGRPTIIVTQSLNDLPFDIRDMQSLQYDRNQLTRTLGQPLQQMVVDTIALQGPKAIQVSREDELVGELLAEVRDLKSMVAGAVKSRNFERLDSSESIATERVLESLQGAWSTEGTNLYARVVNGQLTAPYCFRGDSDLTGVYFGWRKSGEYWFSRFAWINEPITGFAFLKHESMDVLRGAWWTSVRNVFESSSIPEMPPEKSGVKVVLQRLSGKKFPIWAESFLKKVQQDGLSAHLPAARDWETT